MRLGIGFATGEKRGQDVSIFYLEESNVAESEPFDQDLFDPIPMVEPYLPRLCLEGWNESGYG